jgi:hypothetical protein
VPTVHHHAVASALLDAGLDLLVEKPLAASLAEADDLIALADKGRESAFSSRGIWSASIRRCWPWSPSCGGPCSSSRTGLSFLRRGRWTWMWCWT